MTVVYTLVGVGSAGGILYICRMASAGFAALTSEHGD